MLIYKLFQHLLSSLRSVTTDQKIQLLFSKEAPELLRVVDLHIIFLKNLQLHSNLLAMLDIRFGKSGTDLTELLYVFFSELVLKCYANNLIN